MVKVKDPKPQPSVGRVDDIRVAIAQEISKELGPEHSKAVEHEKKNHGDLSEPVRFQRE